MTGLINAQRIVGAALVLALAAMGTVQIHRSWYVRGTVDCPGPHTPATTSPTAPEERLVAVLSWVSPTEWTIGHHRRGLVTVPP
jgi:hypothetical protein